MEREMQRVVALRHAADRDQVIRRLQEELGRSREELSRAAVRVREAAARGGRLKPEPYISLRSLYPNRKTPRTQPLNTSRNTLTNTNQTRREAAERSARVHTRIWLSQQYQRHESQSQRSPSMSTTTSSMSVVHGK